MRGRASGRGGRRGMPDGGVEAGAGFGGPGARLRGRGAGLDAASGREVLSAAAMAGPSGGRAANGEAEAGGGAGTGPTAGPAGGAAADGEVDAGGGPTSGPYGS